MDSAILELRQIFRLEHDIPGIDLCVRSQDAADHLDVIADARGAPHIVDGVVVARVVDGEPLCHLGPGIGQIGQLGLVQLLEDIRRDLALQEIGCRDDDIVTGLAGKLTAFPTSRWHQMYRRPP